MVTQRLHLKCFFKGEVDVDIDEDVECRGKFRKVFWLFGGVFKASLGMF